MKSYFLKIKYMCTFMNSKILLFVIYIEINSAPIKHRDGEEKRRYSKKKISKLGLYLPFSL